jgi:exodeoxyribonuclease V beta subunit
MTGELSDVLIAEPGVPDARPALLTRPVRPMRAPGRNAVRYAIPEALAALDPGRHQVVEASAGTGKTYLIEHRVVDLLLSTDTPIEQILVVTFTEKATAELRFRVRRLIEQVEGAREHTAGADEPHWVIDAESRHRLTDALLGFDRASIHTIHAFCQRVITENAFSSRRLFAQTQVAGESAFSETFKTTLREELARDEGHKRYLAAWYRSGRSVEDLEKLLYRCANQNGRLVPDFDEGATASRLRAAAAEMPAVGAEDDAMLAALKKAGVRGASTRAVLRRLAALRTCLDRFALAGDVADFLAAFEAADRAVSSSTRERLLSYVAGQLESADVEDAALAAARDVVLDLDRAVVPLAAAVAQRFLPPVRERLEADKNRRGQFDFQDMLRLVWQSLDNDASDPGEGTGEVCRRLRERYRYALIDEFQDTDELQWKIFRRIYLEGADNRLCIIGDPKQAIYGFRGADVYTYLEARRQVQEQGGQVTNLIDNYRSTDELVRAYNVIFADRYFTGEIRYDHPVRAATCRVARDGRGRAVAPVCVLHVKPEQGKLRAEAMRQVLLGRMAGEIRGLLYDHMGGPAGALAVGPPAEIAPVKAGEIFVLTRTTAESNEVAERLRQAGVPCAIYKQEGLLQTREAREVRDLLCGIAEPRNRSARFQAWTTRFFGATLSDLPHLAELPETHPFVARLYEWKALAERLEYEKLYSSILDQSGIVERELFIEPSERALTNFLHIFELLLEEVMRSRCELHELVQRLERWITDTADDPQAEERNIQRMESEDSAVQVMTVHRSKGLEAKVVFLYGGFGPMPGDEVQVYHDGSERLVHVGAAHRDVVEAVAREGESEDQRLYYVGITRAVARLYLPYVDPDDYVVRGAYAQVNRRLEDIVQRVRSGDRELGALFALERIATGTPAAPPQRARARILQQWRPPAWLLDPAPPAIDYEHARTHRAGFVVTSYSGMKGAGPSSAVLRALEAAHQSSDVALEAERAAEHAIDSARPAPATARPGVSGARFEADEVATGVRAGEDELPGGAQSGVFLHGILEHVPFESVAGVDFDAWRGQPEIGRLFTDAMLRHGRDPQHLPYTQRVIYRCLTTPLHVGRKLVPGLASCERVVRELEFLYPIPTRAGARPQPAGTPLGTARETLAGQDGIRLERGYIKGFIDLVFGFQGRAYLVDWKSDILSDYSARAVARHVYRSYQLQAQLYSLALAKMLEIDSDGLHKRRFGGLLYCFMRGMGGPMDGEGRQPAVYYARPRFEDLVALERDLESRDDYA